MSRDIFEKLISQAEAARLRGCTRQAIQSLITHGRLKAVLVAGHVLLYRDEVLNFKADTGGRPKGSKNKKKRAKPKLK